MLDNPAGTPVPIESGGPMRRIAVLNQKGGVGKTTTVANIAAAMHLAGKRVLLIDLDPQAHLSLHFGVEVADDQASTYDLLVASTPIKNVLLHIMGGLTIVPADIDLAAAEAELISVTGREAILREALQGIDTDYDVLLIDCPPSLGVLTINALSAVQEIIIPLQGHFFSLHGLSKLLETVTLVRQRVNPKLAVAGLVLCMHDKATRLASEVADDLNRFLEAARGQPVAWADARLYRTFIRRNIKLAEASSFGKTIFDYAPRSHGAADYARLTAEILGEAAGPVGPGTETKPGTMPKPPDTPLAEVTECASTPVTEQPPVDDDSMAEPPFADSQANAVMTDNTEPPAAPHVPVEDPKSDSAFDPISFRVAASFDAHHPISEPATR